MKDELSSVLITKRTPKAYVERLASDCKRCGHCCSYDSGIFLDQDIKKAADLLRMPEPEFRKQFMEHKEIFNKKVHKARLRREGKMYGPCIFLEENRCVIQDAKPLHCTVASGCNEYGRELNIWYMLNYVVDEHDPEAIRQWAQYLKTHPTIPGGSVEELVPDKDRREKMLNYELLR